MPLSPVIPSAYGTGRVDLVSSLASLLDAFIASQPSIVRRRWNALPMSIVGERPFVYVGDMTEVVTHDSGTRTTTTTGTVGYVDILADAAEASARADLFADYMRDLFTANAMIVGGGVLEQTGSRDEELAQGQTRMLHVIITYTYVRQEGRD